jgi:xanthine dehydrogenase accessory factor
MSAAPMHVGRENSASGAWLQPLRDWPATVIRSLQTNAAVVRVVIASVRGSSPREVGTSMLVERERVFGTIGGGQLEWSAIATARALLEKSSCAAEVHQLTLGPQLSQCCGGAVELWVERYSAVDVSFLSAAAKAATRGPTQLVTWLAGGRVQRRIEMREGARADLVRENDVMTFRERLDESQPQVWLYGAGHVGQALARVVSGLPLQLTWIDSRPELLPHDISDCVQTLLTDDPVATVAEAPASTRFLVMTHSHPLDYALCKAVLERNDSSWLGVIGSKSKSVRFRSRLLREGLSQAQADRLICPIGIDGVDSKLPAAIAVSVAAQLLQTSASPTRSQRQGHDCANQGCKSCALQPGASL